MSRALKKLPAGAVGHSELRWSRPPCASASGANYTGATAHRSHLAVCRRWLRAQATGRRHSSQRSSATPTGWIPGEHRSCLPVHCIRIAGRTERTSRKSFSNVRYPNLRLRVFHAAADRFADLRRPQSAPRGTFSSCSTHCTVWLACKSKVLRQRRLALDRRQATLALSTAV